MSLVNKVKDAADGLRQQAKEKYEASEAMQKAGQQAGQAAGQVAGKVKEMAGKAAAAAKDAKSRRAPDR